VTVVRLTLREAANRKVLLVGAVISVALLLLFWLGFNVGFDPDPNPQGDPTNPVVAATILTVFGLYAVQLLGAFMAVLLASGAVAPEIDSGRLHAILARPISRSSWLAQRAGTFAGLAVIYVVVMSGAILAIASAIADYGPISPWRGLALLALEVVVLVALGSALSVRFSAIAAGVIVIALYGAAWIGGVMEVIGAAVENNTLERIGVAVSLAIPSDGLWRGGSYYLQSPAFLIAASIENDTGNPLAGNTPPSLLFIAWSVGYGIVWWLLANRWFRRRDL
jgi:ABC-type transport system involved in multi-copper enzyme maturation permease subunit